MLFLLVLLFASAESAESHHAENARWLAHTLSYGVLSTKSVEFRGTAFGNPQSFVDGTISNSTGHIYMYISEMDASMTDINQNPAASFTLSQEMVGGNQCSKADLDPEDPLCMRVVLIGNIVNVTDIDTATWAKRALFERHPGMKSWPNGNKYR